MKLRASIAAGVLAASSVAFGVANIGTVEYPGAGTIDYEKAFVPGDTTAIGTLTADYETERVDGMAPVMAYESGATTDQQFQRRSFETDVDGETVTQERDIAVLGLSGGGFDGFELVDVTDPTNVTSFSRVQCGGFHNDVAIWKDYVVLGWDGGSGPCPLAREALGPQNIPNGNAVYVFDVSDLTAPVPVAVFSGENDDDRLELTSGTHNLGVHPDGFLYFATAGFDAVEPDLGIVDLNDLAAGATMINMKTISPTATDGCHDLGFAFDVTDALGETRDLMVCPAIETTYIWDVSDPSAPTEISAIPNPAINIHHGGRFTPDGSTVVLGDELGGGLGPGCSNGGPTGAMWTYDITQPEAPVLTGYVSSAESPKIATCTSHFYNFVPTVDGSTRVVTGWYRSGMIVHDLTLLVDSPVGTGVLGAGPEVAAILPDRASMWNAYAYYGHIYGGSFSGNTGLFIASLEGYSDTSDAELAPYCNDAGIVWGPSPDAADWTDECRNPGDDA